MNDMLYLKNYADYVYNDEFFNRSVKIMRNSEKPAYIVRLSGNGKQEAAEKAQKLLLTARDYTIVQALENSELCDLKADVLNKNAPKILRTLNQKHF
jgi:hypothetical protein